MYSEDNSSYILIKILNARKYINKLFLLHNKILFYYLAQFVFFALHIIYL